MVMYQFSKFRFVSTTNPAVQLVVASQWVGVFFLQEKLMIPYSRFYTAHIRNSPIGHIGNGLFEEIFCFFAPYL